MPGRQWLIVIEGERNQINMEQEGTVMTETDDL